MLRPPRPGRLAVAAALAALPALARAADPRFALVNAASVADGKEIPCLTGTHAPGQPAVLFGTDLSTCTGTTREAVEALAGGTCTRVELPARCRSTGLAIAVVGRARLEALRAFPRVAVKEPARLAALGARVARSGALAAVAARGKPWGCVEPIAFSPGPAEAFAFPALAQDLVFVRYSVTEEGGRLSYPDGGTLVAVSGERVAAPFDVHALPPFAFGFDGGRYLLGGSSCGECGARLDQIFAVEGGALRLVYQTSDLST